MQHAHLYVYATVQHFGWDARLSAVPVLGVWRT